MPLIHSKKPAAFSKNISTEVHAGKPQKQAVAIAYSIKRKAEKKKHYDDGGEVDDSDDQIQQDPEKVAAAEDSMRKAFGYAKGGHVAGCDCAECMAEGGEVKYDHIADNDNIQDMLGEELMNSIQSKDYKKIMQGMEAMILSCLNKKDSEDA